jgi:hypothetical protein
MAEDGDLPDTGTVPWQLLIRMRYVYQADVLVAAATQRAVVPALPESIGRAFARTVTAIAARAVSVGRTEQRELGDDRVVGVARALDEFGNWCGTWPQHQCRDEFAVRMESGAEPEPALSSPWRESGLAEVAVIVDAALRLVMEVGSPDLRRTLGVALEDTLAALQESTTAV